MKCFYKVQLYFFLYVFIALLFLIYNLNEKHAQLKNGESVKVSLLKKKCTKSIFRRTSDLSLIYFKNKDMIDSLYVDYKKCSGLSNEVTLLKDSNGKFRIIDENLLNMKPLYFLIIILILTLVPYKKLFVNRKLFLLFLLVSFPSLSQVKTKNIEYAIEVKISKPFTILNREINDSIYSVEAKERGKWVDSIKIIIEGNNFKRSLYKNESINNFCYIDSLKQLFQYKSGSKTLLIEKISLFNKINKNDFVIKENDSAYDLSGFSCKKRIIEFSTYKYEIYYSTIDRKNFFSEAFFYGNLIDKDIWNLFENSLIVQFSQVTDVCTTRIYLTEFEDNLNRLSIDLPKYYESKKDKRYNKFSDHLKMYTIAAPSSSIDHVKK